jgi:PAS domain S-box-containing protein
MSPKLDPFFYLSRDCLCIAHYDGYFANINPAFVALLEYSEEELRSKLISEFIYEEDRARTASHRNNLKNNIALVNFENRYVCKSGKIVWLHWTSIPVENERLIYAIAKDITHKKTLENERIEHLGKLSDVNRKLKQLNYTTSHDLRSPVNNLISLVDLIDLSKVDDEFILKLLSYIKLAAEGLNKSLNSHLAVLEQKDISSEKLEEVNFHILFEKVQTSISALIQKSGAKFQLDFSALQSTFFSAAFMESIFLNFITNSIKYAKPDVLPIIAIRTEEKNGEKTFTYSDNGLGFDMDKVGHLIFKLNQRFHGNKDSKGVGLYLVYNHITSLGGSISVASKVNEGATFTITFKA